MEGTDFALGVCVLSAPPKNLARTVSYPHYIHEILAHAGVCHGTVSFEDLPARLPGLKLLVTVGEAKLPDALKQQLTDWVEAGGGWLSVGGVAGLAELFGAEVEPPASSSWGGGLGTLGEGYLKPEPGTHPLTESIPIPLHCFNGVPVRPAGGTVLASILDAHQRPTSRAALLENAVGKGRCLLIAPDVTGTVVRIQQGIGVTRDGVPAADGTAPVADDVLKSGDGGVLDWIFDRQPVAGVTGFSAFLEPIADHWRELLLRSIFYLCVKQEVALPVLWLYPNRLPAVGHLSHDTDGNNPELGDLLLATLQKAQVVSTWCVILPGYGKEQLARIRDAGCELAVHYDAMEHPWGESEFDRQWRELCALLAPEAPVSNKNHYLRWQGDTEFFSWCVARGILFDESKGASKTGEAGFNFGTCHPHFPVTFDGETLDVLEFPTPTQDLNIFAPDALAAPLLQAALKHHGVMHLLFHPAHIDKPGVAEALLAAVAEAKRTGMEWWTAAQLNTWERARRKTRWTGVPASAGGAAVGFRSEAALKGATLLWLSPSARPVILNGKAAEAQPVTYWGFRFESIAIDTEARRELVFELGR